MRQLSIFRKSAHYLAGMFVCLTALLILAGCSGSSNVSGGGAPAVTQTIGSAGGGIVNGNATLTVSSSTSTTNTTTALYSVQQTNSYPADTRVVPGTVFNFSSSASTLSATLRISIRYNAGALPKGAQESSLQLYEVVNNVWTVVSDTSLDINNKVVSGTATTLGVYGILASTIITSTGGGTGSNRATELLFLANSGQATAGTLYANAVGSATASPITTTGSPGSEIIGQASLSPDVKTLVYDTQSTTGNLLVVTAVDGTNIKPIVTGGLQPNNQAAIPRSPSYSADGKTIVFIYNQTGSDQIYTVKPDGTGLTQITKNFSGFNVSNPAFTKAGVIRFTSTATATSTTAQYNLVNSDGTGLSSTTTFGPSVVPWYTYSPDGTKIVYVSQTSGKFDVFTMNADGTSPTQITKLSAPSIDIARFSTDGTQILFSATTSSNATNSLYTIKTDGTNQQALTTPLTGSALTLLDAH